VDCHSLEPAISDLVDETQINHDGLQEIFRDISSVSHILAHNVIKLEPFAFQEIVISVLNRLLHLYPLYKSGLENEIDRLFYLTLLAFMSTMLFQPGRRKRLPYELLAKRFRTVVIGMSRSDLVSEPMLLWILHVGVISVLQENDLVWVVPWIKSIASSLDIRDWQSAQEQLYKYPWIRVFHDGPGQKLWDTIKDS
jgi:hypothetical protein